MASIYGIFFPCIRKVYIGSSGEDCPAKRWWAHLRMLRDKKHHCKALQKAYDGYGERSMMLKHLELVPMGERRVAEQRWIDRYKSRGCALNTDTADADTRAESGLHAVRKCGAAAHDLR